MKDIKAHYKLVVFVPMIALSLTNCTSKNVITMANPETVIVKDVNDHEERVFTASTSNEFEFLRVGDTVDVVHHWPVASWFYNHRRILQQQGSLGITQKSLENATVRYVKEKATYQEKQR